MITGLQQFDVGRLRPLLGFAPTDESKLANVKLRLDAGRTLAARPTRHSFAVLGRARGAIAQLGRLPEPGETIHCILNGEYCLADFLPAVIELSGAVIDDLHVATLSFSKRNVDALAALAADGLIGNVTVLCSHYFAAQDREIYEHMIEQLRGERFRIVAMRTHAKVLLMRAGTLKLAVESSANLRSCHNVEQATIIRDDGVYDFHKNWMDDLLKRALARGSK